MNNFLQRVDFDKLPNLPDFIMAMQTVERATHHETKEEVSKALFDTHKQMFEASRGVYALLLTLSGAEVNKEIGSVLLLGNPETGLEMPKSVETAIIRELIESLKTTRRFRLFVRLAESKINNNRTRKLVLRHILTNDKLELWAVKYRKKMAYILNHFVGMSQIGIVKTIVGEWVKDGQVSATNNAILRKLLFVDEFSLLMREAIAFVYGIEGSFYTSEMFKAFFDARADFSKASILPPEVAEGIRSTYHPGISKKVTLQITKDVMTSEQTVRKQRSLKKAGVTLKPKLESIKLHELIKILYLNVSQGEGEPVELFDSAEVISEIDKKAKEISKTLSFTFVKAGILVDNSFSSIGDEGSAKRDPISKIVAMKRVLMHNSPVFAVEYVTNSYYDNGLPVVAGQTDLATPFLELVKKDCDGIFVLSDGRDNAPAGRLTEIIKNLKRMNALPTVIHFNPVVGGESLIKIDPSVQTFGMPQIEGIQEVIFAGLLEQAPKAALESMYMKYQLLS